MEDSLLQVMKPGRYIGREWNVSRKDFSAAAVKFALCFPDLYEIGMSNLGMRILYGMLNSMPDVACERFFSCGDDMENNLRNSGEAIFSLESGRPLSEFDIIGFSLGSELNYTNVLNMLDLGGIPLKSSERGNRWPLIIGGGPCMMNPEPIHEFFDLFLIGEGEEAVAELMGNFRNEKDRHELLLKLAKIEGVYVPSFYDIRYDAGGRILEFRPKFAGVPAKVKKRVVADLNSAYFPQEWLVPYIQIVHDRIVLEVMRGCPNRCRFCQARSQYYPFRKREVKNIVKAACTAYDTTGYEEIALGGLSVSDYKELDGLLSKLLEVFKPKAVNISLPSLKAKAVLGSASSKIAGVKKTGLTFAPEAGTERLREVLAKDFSEVEFFQALDEAYASGYQHVKLYFMIGIPGEEARDLDGIAELADRVSEARKKTGRGAAQVNISINALIPKPHTAFERHAMAPLEILREKEEYLRKILKNKRIKVDFHDREMSFVEAVLSRGDRRLSAVILNAYKNGARFDAWSSHFSVEKWLSAFSSANIVPESYLSEKNKDEVLPWSFLDIGINSDR